MRKIATAIVLLTAALGPRPAHAQLTLGADGHVSIGAAPPAASVLTVGGELSTGSILLSAPPPIATGPESYRLVWDAKTGKVSREAAVSTAALTASLAELSAENRRLREVLDALTREVASLRGTRETVKAPGANAIRLRFSDAKLGPQARIGVTSVKDGATQWLDRQSLAWWNFTTAYFNGDAVVVDFFDAEAKATVIVDLVSGVPTPPPAGKRPPAALDICGEVDHRVSSADPGVARVMPTGCTTWHAPSGAFLTAGHCKDNGIEVIQFDVPPSHCDGKTVQPPPADQYPVDGASIVTQLGDRIPGNDYAIFRVLPNGTTQTLAAARGEFFRPTVDPVLPGARMRLTGFGASTQPSGCAGGKNALSQTQQTEAGTFIGYDIVAPAIASIEYHIDTTDGNSGSPPMLNGTRTVLGIHTTGGCNGSPTSANSGTAFANVELQQALQTFPGANVVYVDTTSVSPQEDGSIFHPFVTAGAAFAAAKSGALVSVATGSYERTLTLTRPVTLVAPVGTVTFGTRDSVLGPP